MPWLDPAIKTTATYYDARVTQAERLNFELVANSLAACQRAGTAHTRASNARRTALPIA